jgi:hypothetical protein
MTYGHPVAFGGDRFPLFEIRRRDQRTDPIAADRVRLLALLFAMLGEPDTGPD